MLKRTRQNSVIFGAFAAAAMLMLLCVSWQGQALTDSGTRILNQAAATFVDTNGVVQDVTSNQVETIIQQVAGLDLVSSQSKPGVPNGQVLFPHVLTNTGNGPDTYEICVGNEVGGFSFDSLSVFEDSNEDGLPDSSTQIIDGDLDGCLDIGPLSPGETFSFVVVAETPNIVAASQNSQFEVEATSDFDLSLSASNIDDVTLIDGPLIEVVKSLSQYTGFAGTNGYSVTLEYRNVGNEAATDLIISDVLPTQAADGSTGDLSLGMIYTSASAEWQQGTAADLLDNLVDPLSDADMAVQAGGGTTAANVIYCAYDVSCITTPFDTDQITIQVDSVPVGAIGSITFDFSVDNGYEDDAVLKNFASFEYRDALDTVTFGTYVSNTVNFVITEEVEAPGVVANDSNTLITEGVLDSNDAGNIVATSVAQSESAFFSNYIWNSAPAGLDTFDITLDSINDREGTALTNAFPAGTSFTLLNEDGQTPLQDTNGNGIPDTGPINADEFAEVILRVDVPLSTVGTNSGNGWSVTKIATSIADSTVTNAVTDRLDSVAASSVDLTNSSDGTEGAGQGPEGAPVNTIVIQPAAAGVFQLWVENTSPQPDSYTFAYSDQNFVVGTLPAGWSVSFYVDGGAGDCSTTGPVASGAFVVLPGAGAKQLFCATINIVNGTAPVIAQDLYFRVLSDSTGAFDIKRDAVTVPEAPLLEIESDIVGQIEPGATAAYPHIIFNRGNQDLECVNISLSDTKVAEGWTSSAYLDVDENGQLSAGDVLLTDQIVAVGDELRVIVRLYAPFTAVIGIQNTTTVIVEGEALDGSGCGSGALLTDQVLDRTTTTNTDMVITKKQLLDSDCNGTVDIAPSNTDPSAVFSLSPFTVLPGECVIYRLDATNQGVAILFNAVVRDIVPGYTSYLASAQQCLAQDADPCAFVSPPADGATTGAITVESAQVLPSGTVTVFFGIKVE